MEKKTGRQKKKKIDKGAIGVYIYVQEREREKKGAQRLVI